VAAELLGEAELGEGEDRVAVLLYRVTSAPLPQKGGKRMVSSRVAVFIGDADVARTSMVVSAQWVDADSEGG
jgi:hypothetical protein